MSGSNFKEDYENNKKVRKEEAGTVRKIVATVLITLTIVLVVGVIGGYFYISSALDPVDEDDKEPVNVEIPTGATNSEIASVLEENGIISNSTIFRFYTKFNNETGFQAGNYQFTPSMKLDNIIESLQNGRIVKDPINRVTIPEGYTLKQIAEVYAEEYSFTQEEFMNQVDDEEYVKQLMESHSALLTDEILGEDIRHPLEGYLFAATYPFYKEDVTVKEIVEKMISKTESVVLPRMESLEEKGLNVHEAVTMASLLENEARTAESRREIAGVFYNRLEEEMPLQTDPTVAYAHGEHLERTMYDDLEIESPYNTYHVNGLPVGPISNFNENSIEAAAAPISSENLYFLADEEGNVHYSETLEEHNQKKEEYLSDE
ncbi:endolytic transglycosylase MltG [Salimicrobium sp. PL1-032A]|uniref:endolytic transglycosylase MltG n=1 Tax=Salimicrobium sp. PL1-032A TaxID=3095364 RepID=UPI003261CC33